MNEATLKAGLVKALKRRIPTAVVLRHEDKFRAGIPDISVTLAGRLASEAGAARIVWVEVKYDRPGARGRLTAIQERMLRALGGLLVLYVEDPSSKGVQVGEDAGWILANTWQGFDHAAVAEVIARRFD